MIPEIIAASFALLVLLKSYDEFRRGREPLPVFLFWLVTWLAVLVIAFFPGVTFWIRDHILGPRAGLGTIFGIAIVFLLFLNYRMYLKADRVERDLQKLISDLAVHEFEKSQDSNK
ncbi:MAG: DUF2304 family protein [Patescibacteria group bacterium]